jgi:Holliday junction resolvase
MKKVIKKTGIIEDFDENKIIQSLINVGADEVTASKICKTVYDKIPNLIRADDLWKITLKELKKYHLGFATKYNLKKAIYNLGPSGFPFERYFAKLLAEYGYETIIDEWIEGKCLNYEIDIVAVKDEERYIIECKFHNQAGVKSDLKTVLYVFGRWLDIKEKFPYLKNWLATNTKITDEGIKFAECRNIKITAWKYPPSESLEKLIEQKGIYPVTILLSGNKFIYTNLIQNNFVIIQDLFRYKPEEISKMTGIELNKIRKLIDEAKNLSQISPSP